jgi:hypothetical protein
LGSNGEYWRTVRKATIRGLKSFLISDNENSVESKIRVEVEDMERVLTSKSGDDGAVFHWPETLGHFVSSALLNIVTGTIFF